MSDGTSITYGLPLASARSSAAAQIVGVLDALTLGAVRIGQLDEVRVVRLAGVLAHERRPRVGAVEQQFGGLSLDTELASC